MNQSTERHKLNGAVKFSKLDLTNGYHQLELHPSSRDITTVAMHVGLYRYRRLNFGTFSATEIFHEELRKQLADVSQQLNINDDILIFGRTQVEHDIALEAVLKRLEDVGLTVNMKKCKFNTDNVEFFGVRFTSKGLEPGPAKVEDLRKAEAPSNKSELKSFLGMANFSSRFVPNYSEKTRKLRELLPKNTKWRWTHVHEEAFDELKKSLQANTVLGCFNVKAPPKIIVDASSWGASVMLVQFQDDSEKVIAYSSRSLTETEKRYSQIERECLAIYFGCFRFQMYITGKAFTVCSDHTPLMHIFNNLKRTAPFRIERMRLKLQGFSFKFEHVSDNKSE